MPAFLYLLLAHLIADFALQPYGLVKLKARPVGLAIHSGIHALITALVAAPVIPRWWLVIPLLGVAHYVIDRAKVNAGHTDGPASFMAFMADQAAHLVVLGLAAALAGVSMRAEVWYGPPALTAVLFYAVPYVGATFAGAILVYQFAVAFDTRLQPAELLAPRLRLAGYVERGVMLTLVLFAAPVFWVAGAAWYVARLLATGGAPRRRAEVFASLILTVAWGVLFRGGVAG